MVLLLFLFMAQPAVTGPTPPGWNRINNDPIDDTPWEETSSSSNEQSNGDSTPDKTHVTVTRWNEYIPIIALNQSFLIVVKINQDLVSLEDEQNNNIQSGVN